MATTDVIITKRGWVDPVTVQLNDIRVSWEINTAGMMSGGVPVALLAELGLPLDDLGGYWVLWEHPLLGRWSGIITSCAVAQDRVMQLTAETHHVLLRKIFQAATGGVRGPVPRMYPGQLVKWVLDDVAAIRAQVGDASYLAAGTIETGHQPVEVEWELADYYDEVMPALTRDIGYEWDVTPDLIVNFGRTLGSDLRSSVRLAEGVEISTFSLDSDVWDVTNALTGIGTFYSAAQGRIKKPGFRDKIVLNERWDMPVGEVARSASSIQRYGVLAEAKDYGFIQTAAAIVGLLANDLTRGINPPAALTLEVVPIGTYWATFSHGDIIKVNLGSIGLELDFRIMVRAYDSTTGVLTLSGDAWLLGYEPLPNVFIPLPDPAQSSSTKTIRKHIKVKKKKKKNAPGKGKKGGGANKKKKPKGKR